MPPRPTIARLSLAVALACVIAPLAAAAAPMYVATKVGELPGKPYSTALGINATGAVVGTSGGNRAYIHIDGTTQLLSLQNSTGYSTAQAINDSGQVTGCFAVPGGQHAFLYSAGATKDLGTLGDNACGQSINAAGHVAGYTSGNPFRAFLYTGGALQDLGALGDSGGYAKGIANNGDVTGCSAVVGAAGRHAFLYSGGAMRDLGTLGGAESCGYGFSADGKLTGEASTPDGRRAFLYAGGTMTNLGTVRDDASSTGYAVNSRGQVVGYFGESPNLRRALLYSDGTMHDLNSLVVSGLDGFTLTSANAINDSGQIAANSCRVDGYSRTFCHGYRLDPVASPPVVVSPRVGLWWNPDESGSGYNIDVRHGTLVLTVFSYKQGGEAQWYIASGPLSADGSRFDGVLGKLRQGQCLSCPYAGMPVAGGDDGPVSITFSSSTAAVMTLPGGRAVPIQPQAF